jgi:hypothetical protein
VSPSLGFKPRSVALGNCVQGYNWTGVSVCKFQTMPPYQAGIVTKAGLKVRAVLRRGENGTGECISASQMRSLNLKAAPVCPMWNYTLRPQNGSKQNGFAACCQALVNISLIESMK